MRTAAPRDIEKLARIDALAHDRSGREAQLARFCNDPEGRRFLLLVLFELNVCGYLAYSLLNDEATLHDIAIDPVRQGTGLGKCLLTHCLEQMQSRGAVRCLLEVRASNGSAIAMYRGCGFRLDGERRNYYPAGTGREDALLMSRKL